MNTKSSKTITKLLGLLCIMAITQPSFCEPGILRDAWKNLRRPRVTRAELEQTAKEAIDAANRAAKAAEKAAKAATKTTAAVEDATKAARDAAAGTGMYSAKVRQPVVVLAETPTRSPKNYTVSTIGEISTIREVVPYLQEGSYAALEDQIANYTKGYSAVVSNQKKWETFSGGGYQLFNSLDAAMEALSKYAHVATPDYVVRLRAGFQITNELPTGEGSYYVFKLPDPVSYSDGVLTSNKYVLVQSVEGGPVFLVTSEAEAEAANYLLKPVSKEFADLPKEEQKSMNPVRFWKSFGFKIDYTDRHDLYGDLSIYVELTPKKAIGTFTRMVNGEKEEFVIYKLPTSIRLLDKPVDSHYHPDPSYTTYSPDDSYIVVSQKLWEVGIGENDPDVMCEEDLVQVIKKEELEEIEAAGGGKIRLFQI